MKLPVNPQRWPEDALVELRTRMNSMHYDGGMTEQAAREAAEEDTRRVWERWNS